MVRSRRIGGLFNLPPNLSGDKVSSPNPDLIEDSRAVPCILILLELAERVGKPNPYGSQRNVGAPFMVAQSTSQKRGLFT